jgi:hypothetical protein
MRALFDINLLIALLDESHEGHERAREWLSANIRKGWASCPLTQNGVIRIMSQPKYPNVSTPVQVMARLAHAIETPHHLFLPDDVSLLDPGRLDLTRVLGPRQVTDLYLLALAVKHGVRFVTFDGAVPVGAIKGARREHLVVL